MLHVDTKKSKWKDLPIPFPTVGTQKTGVPGDTGGVKQLGNYFPRFSVSKRDLRKPPSKSSNGDIDASN